MAGIEILDAIQRLGDPTIFKQVISRRRGASKSIKDISRSRMNEAVKLFAKKDVPLEWEYDGDADTFYLSFGKPVPATGIDIGDGVILRYDEHAREVVGLTIVGVGRRLEEHVKRMSHS